MQENFYFYATFYKQSFVGEKTSKFLSPHGFPKSLAEINFISVLGETSKFLI